MSDKKLIEELKQECRRVKIQRNNLEQELIMANRKRRKLEAEIIDIKNSIKYESKN